MHECMYIYIYIYTYVCMQVNKYVYIYVKVIVCIYVYLYVSYVGMYLFIFIFKYICVFPKESVKILIKSGINVFQFYSEKRLIKKYNMRADVFLEEAHRSSYYIFVINYFSLQNSKTLISLFIKISIDYLVKIHMFLKIKINTYMPTYETYI